MTLSKKANSHASDRVYVFYILGAIVVCVLVAIGCFFFDAHQHQGTLLYLIAAVLGGISIAGAILCALLLGLVMPSKIAGALKARGRKSESTG